MIKNNATSSEVNLQIDAILLKMDTIATIVPEFGSLVMLILVISIVTIIGVSSRSKISVAYL